MSATHNIPLYQRLTIAFVITALATFLMSQEWTKSLSHYCYDVLFDIRGPIEAPEDIIILSIDEPSFAEIQQRWPWPRTLHAEVIEKLFEAGARTVAFDVIFAEPSRDSKEDQAFAAAIDKYKHVVLASDVSVSEDAIGFQMSKTIEPGPVMALANTQIDTGFVNMSHDSEGFVRSLAMAKSDKLAFSLVAVKDFLSQKYQRDVSIESLFDLNDESQRFVNYYGPKQSFRYLSYYFALDPENSVPKDFFKDKLIFVGFTTASEATIDDIATDHFQIPYTRFGRELMMPGVEIHAHAAANIINQNFITPLATPLRLLYGSIIGFLGGLLFFSSTPRRGLIYFSLLFFAIFYVALHLFENHNANIGLDFLLFPLVLNYIASPILHYLNERKQRTFIRGAFSTYLAPRLVDQLIAQPDMLELGGVELESSVLFLDLAGFTAFSERLPPKELLEVINRNLGEFAEIILKWEGMIDKYIGDCIMAVWGVPIAQEDHIQRASSAALEMKAAMLRLAKREKELTDVDISMRIGLNSGNVIAGNVGGGQQLNYTVLGNTVNLAARLEGANKFYGTEIILNEDSADALDDSYALRELDMITVVGKKIPVRIFELLAMRDDLSEGQVELIKRFDAARTLYREQEFGKAKELFSDLQRDFPEDKATSIYIDRCAEFIISPPDPSWDGVYQMKTK
jgi:adenylate cyclase